ncbi:hypothetical protein BH09BAC1_BH09BAC1_19010 [soil metagenome]
MQVSKLVHGPWTMDHGCFKKRFFEWGRGMFLLFGCMLFLVSCKKEEIYVYEVNDVKITQDKGDKNNVKSQTEFIAIAFSDLFQTGIDRPSLEILLSPYLAFGDQKLIEQMIIKTFLNVPAADIPTKQQMDAGRAKFIDDAYVKFYSRHPDEFELWHFEKLLVEDPSITPQMFYFAILTSDEYRYY